jgi:hypothetical protein
MAAGSDRRVSDAEREAVAAALGMHFAAGMLTMNEFRARLNAVHAAGTADELARVTADLPAGDPGTPGAGAGAGPGGSPAAGAGLGALTSCGQRALGRILAVAAVLAASAVTGVILLVAALAGHGGLLAPGLILLFAPAGLLAATAGALVWAGRRAWRSAAWLEEVPAAPGMPRAGGPARALRVLAVSRLFLRLAALAGRPLRPHGPRRGTHRGSREATAWFQDEPGGEWHQARVRGGNGQ